VLFFRRYRLRCKSITATMSNPAQQSPAIISAENNQRPTAAIKKNLENQHLIAGK